MSLCLRSRKAEFWAARPTARAPLATSSFAFLMSSSGISTFFFGAIAIFSYKIRVIASDKIASLSVRRHPPRLRLVKAGTLAELSLGVDVIAHHLGLHPPRPTMITVVVLVLFLPRFLVRKSLNNPNGHDPLLVV